MSFPLLFFSLLLAAGCGGGDAAGPVTGPIGSPSSAAYPLGVSENGRYLVDRNNRPFLLTGDSPQALIVNLSRNEADFFFADRAEAGFNAVWINLLSKSGTGGRPDGRTFDGIAPFTVPDSLSVPNEAYFSRADAMIRLAGNHGLVVFLNPIETIDWLSVLRDNGEAAARQYGRFLGSRYRTFDNIVWFHGNDFQTWPDRGDAVLVQAVALGIQEQDNRHLQTVLLNFDTSGSLDDESWRPIIQVNSSYTYFPTYAQVLKDYSRPNFLPTILAEASYEFENDGTSAHNLRRQEYWALLSGAAGQFYGNRFTWQFLPGWQGQLDTPGSQQIRYVNALFSSRPWYDLVPDQQHRIVTQGFGTFADSGSIRTNDYLAAAATPDGRLAIAYVPSPRTFTVDMSRFSAAAHVQWYDPTNGQFIQIARAMPNRGTMPLTSTSSNSEGTGDWVLVIEVE